jgi:hypothetical protein
MAMGLPRQLRTPKYQPPPPVKAQPCKLVHGEGYFPCTVEAATHLRLNIPGPTGELVLPVQIKGRRDGTGNWTWNGDVDRPTLRPSVLSQGGDWRCHSWITDGRAQFLDDCTHELRGQTVDLLDVRLSAEPDYEEQGRR